MEESRQDGSAPSQRRQDGGAPSQDLLKLWLAQFISKAGDQLFVLTGVFLVLLLYSPDGPEAHGAATRAGLMDAARALPALLFGLFAGVCADRYDRRWLMVVSDLARAGVLAVVVGTWLLGGLQWWMLPAAAFLASTFSSVFEPARDAFLPSIVGKQGLLRANALFQTSMPLAVVAGSLAVAAAGFHDAADVARDEAGVLVALVGVDAVTFVLSAALLLWIRTRNGVVVARAMRPPVGVQVREMLALVVRDRRLVALLLLTAANNLFLMGPATVGAAILFKRELGLSVGAFGLFEGCMAAGLLLGLLWVLRYGGKWPRGKLLMTGLVLDGATYVPFVFMDGSTPLWVYYAMITFHGFFIPWIVVPRTALVQSLWPSAVQGRVFAAIAMTVTGFHAISAALTGLLAESVDAWTIFAIGGGGAAVVGLLGFGSKTLRGLR